MSLSLKRGDLIEVDLDPTEGSEINKTRPCVVVQNDVGNVHNNCTIICPVTGYKDNKNHPTEVVIEPSDILTNFGEDGLSKKSRILADQIRVVSRTRVIAKLGTVSPNKMTEVDDALKISLAL